MTATETVSPVEVARAVCAELGNDWEMFPMTDDDRQESADWWKRRSIQHKTRPYHITFSEVGTWGAGRGKMHISGDPGVRPYKGNCSFSLRDIANPYADGYDAAEYKKSINVSPTKSPAKIAADITRRLLPGLEKFTQAAEKRRAEQIDCATGEADTLARVAKALGGNVREHGYKAGQYIESLPDGFRFEHSSRDSVTVSVSLSPAEWEKIGQAITS